MFDGALLNTILFLAGENAQLKRDMQVQNEAVLRVRGLLRSHGEHPLDHLLEKNWRRLTEDTQRRVNVEIHHQQEELTRLRRERGDAQRTVRELRERGKRLAEDNRVLLEARAPEEDGGGRRRRGGKSPTEMRLEAENAALATELEGLRAELEGLRAESQTNL
jgi:hypothetical protein